MKPKLGCEHCAGEQEPGYIETPDNGPIVPCPMCNHETDYDRAERQHGPGSQPFSDRRGSWKEKA